MRRYVHLLHRLQTDLDQNAKPHPPCFERTHQHHQFAMNLQKLQRLHHAGMLLTGPRQNSIQSTLQDKFYLGPWMTIVQYVLFGLMCMRLQEHVALYFPSISVLYPLNTSQNAMMVRQSILSVLRHQIINGYRR